MYHQLIAGCAAPGAVADPNAKYAVVYIQTNHKKAPKKYHCEMYIAPGFLFKMAVIAQRLTIPRPRNKMKAVWGGNSSNSWPVVAPAKIDRTPVVIPISQITPARMRTNGLRTGAAPKRDNSQMPAPKPAQVAHP